MCANTASVETEAPSELDRLLERIARESDGGKTATLSAADVSVIFDLSHENDTLWADLDDLQKRYDARVRIERAKELVAEQLGVKLADAFRLLQKQASAKNKKLEEIAEIVLISEDLRREREERIADASKRREA